MTGNEPGMTQGNLQNFTVPIFLVHSWWIPRDSWDSWGSVKSLQWGAAGPQNKQDPAMVAPAPAPGPPGNDEGQWSYHMNSYPCPFSCNLIQICKRPPLFLVRTWVQRNDFLLPILVGRFFIRKFQ